MNTILTEPQPNFFTIKNMIPHYNYGRGKQGQLIYWDRPGDCKFDELFARGLTVDDLFRHWLFVTEYQWNITLGEYVLFIIASISNTRQFISFLYCVIRVCI